MGFEFAPSKFPPRKTFAAKTGASNDRKTLATAKKTVKKPTGKAVGSATAGKAAGKKTGAAAAPRKRAASTAAGRQPSAELATVIGSEPVARPAVIKKLWDYIKANGLQDATNKRNINADEKLLAVFGKPQVTMFELAGIVGKHLS